MHTGAVMPDLSIIIVNWNTRKLTLACIESLYRETYEVSFETIVVDNGSTDGSAEEIAAAFPQVRLMAETVNHGFAKANNIAAQEALGRRLLLLNSDTLVLNKAVDTLAAFADHHADAGIWGGRTIFSDGSLNIGSAWGAQTPWSAFCFAAGLTALFPRSNFFNPEGITGWQRDSERQVDIVSGCFLMIDTALWRRLDGFDLAFFMYGEEADLCRRARNIGARPRVTPDATIVHYGGASGAVRANSSVSICRAKIGLARRGMTPAGASFTRACILASVITRRIGFGLAAGLSDRFVPRAKLWREVLARRSEWMQGT